MQKVRNVTCEEIKFLKVKSWVKKLSETWAKLKKDSLACGKLLLS